MRRLVLAAVLVVLALVGRGCAEGLTSPVYEQLSKFDVTDDGRIDLTDALVVLEHFGDEPGRAVPMVVIAPADYPLPNTQQPYTLNEAAQAVCADAALVAADVQAQVGLTFRPACSAIVSSYTWAELHPDGAGLDGCEESVLPGGEGYTSTAMAALHAELVARGVFPAGDRRTVMIVMGAGGWAAGMGAKTYGYDSNGVPTWYPGMQNQGDAIMGDWRLGLAPCCVRRWNAGFCAPSPWTLGHELRHAMHAPELGLDPWHDPPVGCCGEALTDAQRADLLAPRNRAWLTPAVPP